MIHLYKGIPQSMITKLTPENQAMLTEYVQHYHLDVTTALQNLREVHWNPQGAAYLAENANVCTQNALIVFFSHRTRTERIDSTMYHTSICSLFDKVFL